MDEQQKNWRMVTNAATTNANSIVQRIPKSNPGGEQQAEQRDIYVSLTNPHQSTNNWWKIDGHRGAVPILAESY